MTAGFLAYGHSPMNSPSVTDVDNDGRDEVAAGLYSLSVFDLEGQKPIGTGIGAKIAPAISDVDGDGRFEFAGIGDNSVQIGRDDGSLFWERIFSTDVHFLSPAIFTDLDTNGRMEFAVVQGRLPNEPGDLVAYLWKLPDTSADSSKSWPMFLHDPQRSGRLVVSNPGNMDIIPPTTSISFLFDGSSVSGTIEVMVEASDDVGVNMVELYRNGAFVERRSSGPYIFSWDTSQENGQYTLQSKAYDVADNVGITKIEFTVNGIVECTDTSENSACTWNVPAKPGVSYSLQALAYDAQGNAGTSVPVKIFSE